MIKEQIEQILGRKIVLVHPKALSHGDYSLIADVETAEEDFKKLKANKPEGIERIEFVKPRFINFYLSKKFFADSLAEIVEKGEAFGKGNHAKGFKVMVEHTDPNPFKEFHIGHLMPNVIGSTIARICEWNGAEVKQVNYQGDVGLHVAKALAFPVFFMEEARKENENLKVEVIQFDWETLRSGKDYVIGTKNYENDEEAKKFIDALNRKIYDKSDPDINYIYQKGKEESLKYFESVYQKLNTKFDFYFFESETAPIGKKIVEENVGKIFEESDGAIVFKGENFDPSLHTRVFINSQGIPTYEAKDLGNAKNKSDTWAHDLSIVVTGNEIKDYFRVVLAAMAQVLPDLARKTKHLPHGMLRLPTGKMSSRTGNVITAEALIEMVKEKVREVMQKSDKASGPALQNGTDEQIAIAAIKYMILRQGVGQDIIFDFEKSVSTEGDSGVYLQYAHARANSILEKAKDLTQPSPSPRRGQTHSAGEVEVREIEKLLYRFPEIIERAGAEYAPNYITTYLTELAGSFNNFYAHEQVIGTPEEAYKLALVEAFRNVMKNGLTILGIPAPERM